jgi:lipoprotein-anchoring transpeptidase ErfK/SrfK
MARRAACGLLAGLALAAWPAGARADLEPNLARVLVPTPARSAPGSGPVLMRVRPVAPLSGRATVLRVVRERRSDGRRFVKVLLPMRPNGTAGWVRADRVRLGRTPYAVTIDRSARMLTVRRDGRVVRRERIVVGAPGSPTPRGEFAISEEIRRASPHEFTGAWILPLTAFSGTYRQFAGGPGRVAIHGRGGASLRDPLGTAASHGCVRVTNRAVRWMARRLSPGVPVRIR